MNEPALPTEFLQLPIPERVVLVEKLWDSIADDETQFELTDTQKAELDRRLESHLQDPKRGKPWEDVKERLTSG